MKLSQLRQLLEEYRGYSGEEDPEVEVLLNGRKPDEGEIIDIWGVRDGPDECPVLLLAAQGDLTQQYTDVGRQMVHVVRSAGVLE